MLIKIVKVVCQSTLCYYYSTFFLIFITSNKIKLNNKKYIKNYVKPKPREHSVYCGGSCEVRKSTGSVKEGKQNQRWRETGCFDLWLFDMR